MKKKLLSIFLAITMALTPVFFAGCDIEDEIKDSATNAGQEAAKSFVSEFFDGFKVVYSNSMTGQVKDKEKLMAIQGIYVDIFNTLNAYYGSGSNEISTFFPDSIRQLIIKNSSGKAELIKENNKDIAWKWTLGDGDFSKSLIPLKDGENNPITYENYVETFNTYKEGGVAVYPQLSKYYAIPIQIVLFETMLGYKNKKTTFEFDVETTTVYVDECPNNTSLNGKDVTSDEVKNYLGYFNETDKTNCGLKLKYYSTATYSGLTKADADSFIDYILNEVIGADVVAYDYTTFGPNQTTYRQAIDPEHPELNNYNYYNYRNYVGRVAEMVYSQVYDGTAEFKYTYNGKYQGQDFAIEFDYISNNETLPQVGGFSPKSVSYLSDYETEAFYESEDAFKMFDDEEDNSATSFENSPLAEYQSVTIMLNKQQDFGGMLMEIFSPNPDLAINLYVRCYLYDETTQTGQLFEWKQDDIDFYQDNPYSESFEQESNEYQDYVDGKGYLFKTTDKNNAGNPIVGYYTDFEVGVNLAGVPDKYKLLAEDKNVDDIQTDAVIMSKFNNFELKDGTKMKADVADGASYKGRVEASLDKASYAYKVVQSKNGFGGVTVLDETKAECSFYEVVFDIKKDPNLPNQNYDFKLAIVTPI